MPAPTTQFFRGRMPFMPPNQQHQSTEGNNTLIFTGSMRAQTPVLWYVTGAILRFFALQGHHAAPIGYNLARYYSYRCRNGNMGRQKIKQFL